MTRNAHTPQNFGPVVARIIKELMAKKKITTSEICYKVGGGRGSIYGIIEGKVKNPSFFNVFEIVTQGLEMHFSDFAKILEQDEADIYSKKRIVNKL